MRTGITISHYRIGDLIGRGGMGEVYQAVDTRLDRPVALKFLAARFVSDAGAKERFIREAKAASALDHPNICTIHDIGETEDGDLFIVMALYDGATLEHRLKDETFSVHRTVDIIRQVAEGLRRAHAGGIIHRDVKPANIVVSDEGAVRLLDFGVAKLQSAEALTRTGTSLGTAVYMSPEQAVGDPVTPASDIWSLGVLAYQIFTGRLPFKGDVPIATVHQILSTEPQTSRAFGLRFRFSWPRRCTGPWQRTPRTVLPTPLSSFWPSTHRASLAQGPNQRFGPEFACPGSRRWLWPSWQSP